MGRVCGLSTVVTPAGASLSMYREIYSHANSIWDDDDDDDDDDDEYIYLSSFCSTSLTNQDSSDRYKAPVPGFFSGRSLLTFPSQVVHRVVTDASTAETVTNYTF